MIYLKKYSEAKTISIISLYFFISVQVNNYEEKTKSKKIYFYIEVMIAVRV